MRFPKVSFVAMLLYLAVQSMLSAQQITTDSSLPLSSLIESKLGANCVEISNISSSINGQVNGLTSYGSFNKGDSDFPFEDGIVLTTGRLASAGNTQILNTLNENPCIAKNVLNYDIDDLKGFYASGVKYLSIIIYYFNKKGFEKNPKAPWRSGPRIVRSDHSTGQASVSPNSFD